MSRPIPHSQPPAKDEQNGTQHFSDSSYNDDHIPSNPPMRQRGVYSEILGRTSAETIKAATMGPSAKQVRMPVSSNPAVPIRSFNLNKSRNIPQSQHTPRPPTGPNPFATSSRLLYRNPELDKGPGVKGGLTPEGDLEPGPSALDPKVHVPYKTAPGQPPRRIEIERKKRYFLQQDISFLLLSHGIDYSLYDLRTDHTTGQPSHVPLDLFDDTDLHYRSPQEWMSLAREVSNPPRVPVRALRFPAPSSLNSPSYPGTPSSPGTTPESDGAQGKWVLGDVLDYDATARLYTVEWRDSKLTEKLPPLCVCFVTEDPELFAKRVARAHTLRREFESSVRYALYVDSMPSDEQQRLAAHQLGHILHLAQSRKLSSRAVPPALVQEVNADYARTMNRLVFDVTMADPSQRALSSALAPSLPPALLRDSTRAAPTWSGQRLVKDAVVRVPAHDFPTHFADFCFHSLYTKAEALAALVKVNVECLKLERMCVFNLSVPHALKPDEFDQVQRAAMAQLSTTLKEKWISALRSCVTSSLKQGSKGWFTLQEQNLEVYRLSKLCKFLTVAHFMMQDAVRCLARDSLAKFATFMRRICAYDVVVVDTHNVTVQYNPTFGGAVSIPALIASDDVATVCAADSLVRLYHVDHANFLHSIQRMAPDFSLFSAEMSVKDGQVVLSTSLDTLRQLPTMLLDRGLQAVLDIPQLETKVMAHLFPYGSEATVATVRKDEPWVAHLYSSVAAWMERALQPVEQYLKLYEQHATLLSADVDAYVSEWAEEDYEPEEVIAEISTHVKAAAAVEELIPKQVNLGIMTVSLEEVRRQVAAKHMHIAQKQLDTYAAQLRARCLDIGARFRAIETELKQTPTDIHQLVKMREYLRSVPTTVATYKRVIAEAMCSFDVLDHFSYKVPLETFKLKWATYAWPKTIADQVSLKDLQLDNDRRTFLSEMHERQDSFMGELMEIEKKVNGFGANNDPAKAKATAEKAEKLNERLMSLQSRAQEFNSQEMLFDLPSTDYRHVGKVIKLFEPYYLLWTTAAAWSTNRTKWLQDPFLSLDGEEVSRSVSDYAKAASKAIKAKVIQNNPAVFSIAESIKHEIDEFKPYLPVVSALRNPGMRDRHWEELRNKLPIPFPKPDESMTLARMVAEYKLHEHIPVIMTVGESAGKEYQIEAVLDKMASQWQGVEFTVVPYKKTGTYIIKDVDAIVQLVDEQTMTTQSMQFSPHKKNLEERISTWASKLQLTGEIIEEWMAVQRQWLGLQAIFSSADMVKQLFAEGKRFQQVHKMWRATMSAVHTAPSVLAFCGENTQLLQKMQDANQQLQMVQKRLSDYLDKKRMGFARFFFLADEELLQILSQAQDPTAVQPHLKKCFENVHAVQFERDGTISAMFSAEQEKVQFTKPVDPRGQNVEDWLGEVEKRMKDSVRATLDQCVRDYVGRPRTEWVAKWPGQTVLAGSQLHFTAEVEAAMKAAGHRGVTKYFGKLEEQLHDLVKIVRGELSTLLSLTLGALIVLDVHNKDIVERLVREKVSAVTDFAWMCQMRYYQQEKQVWVQMVQSKFAYGYEYLGNTLRLVITPLTDRCYMTLMTALSLSLGGAPAGPAGTGKTETVKDLAKAVAKQCVVFNCSEGLNYLAMGKFFKGLASSGAWSCFDEFNRIDIEVLSVVAQQIMTIYEAVKQGVAHFTFEDAEIALEPSCAVFVTMNPGYAGRTELPDNLKALFRPVAMMVPDYAMIGEIMLYSFGFEHAKVLARKMVTTFKLASEQLSAQDHYDYGMRAVKTVITRAGILKRQDPHMPEDALLLTALLDVNVPKFLQQDIPLFQGIINDLFPGVSKPQQLSSSLQTAIILACKRQNLQPTPAFVHKCVQLYETTVVRHGLMVVGPTGGGKTAIRSVLSAALNSLREVDGYMGVEQRVINPKALTMEQLYGNLDTNSKEWTDGIIALIVRECILADEQRDEMAEDGQAAQGQWQWVVFDGPVDALWIENMNTVLDDNKKLCLVSQEILKLTPNMRMVFEVEDLAVASPATVSRCGMVYMEPSALGVQPLLRSWLERLHPVFRPVMATLSNVFDALIEPSLAFLRSSALHEPVASVDSNLVLSLLGLLSALMQPHIPLSDDGTINWNWVPPTTAPSTSDDSPSALAELARQTFLKHIVNMVILCLVWSIGATVDSAGRTRFSNFLQLHLRAMNLTTFAPPRKLITEDNKTLTSVYDFAFDLRRGQWVSWMATQPAFTIDPRLMPHEVIVPTADSVRATFVLDQLVRARKHVLLTGNTGTGKTVNAMQYLSRLSDTYQPFTLTYSAATTANQTEDYILSKLCKRRQKVFGPPLGKQAILFVDDLNMPSRERFFAQPPIELLRQWLDYDGFYNHHTLQFHHIEDTSLVAAMAPPGGGRNPVTPRMIRHLHQVHHTDLSASSLHTIFHTIAQWRMKAFPEPVAALASQVVTATINVYERICVELLPTPAKSHYTFNLRDLAAVVLGIVSAHGPTVADEAMLIRLWVHETRRAFADRLVASEDVQHLEGLMRSVVKDVFHSDWEASVGSGKRILWGNYLDRDSEKPKYMEVADFEDAVAVMERGLVEHGEENANHTKLVLFGDAVEHVSRISRVLRQPGGHALLLGVGGSGRQSLTRLAAHLAEYRVVGMSGAGEWREWLKQLMLRAGLEEEPTVMLLRDSELTEAVWWEDVNNVLNGGEVANLFNNDDMDRIVSVCKVDCQRKAISVSRLNAYAQFLERVKRNLHVVMCMSPMGEAFRERLRMFPALVNCCYIDSFDKWPADALHSVAMEVLSDDDTLALLRDHPSDDVHALCSRVVDVFGHMHQTVEKYSDVYLKQYGRHNHVTPTSYLEVLSTFRSLLKEKRQDVLGLCDKLQKGLDTLGEASRTIATLEVELMEKQPELEQRQRQVLKMRAQIEEDSAAAALTQEEVEVQEAEASVKEAECKSIKDEAQAELDTALPMLDKAVECLRELNKTHIDEVKNFKKPPTGVVLTMEACCIMLQKPLKLKVVMHQDPLMAGRYKPDYWETAKKQLLRDPKRLLDSLKMYDKDNIPESVIQTIEPYIESPEFQVKKIENASKACRAICMWVHAMYKYHQVSLLVEPKRVRLRAAEAEYAIVEKAVQEATARLTLVKERVEALGQQLADAIHESETLEAEVEMCRVKLKRAQTLMNGLGGEGERWAEIIKQKQHESLSTVGDVMIGAASIAYLGAFSGEFRQQLLAEWRERLAAASIMHRSNCSVGNVCGDPVQVRAWHINGLPTDEVSIENAIMMHKARRWPLMIDPQGQANRFIRKLGEERWGGKGGMHVVSLGDKNWSHTIETAIQMGLWVLLENIGETIEDRTLESLLHQQIVYVNGSAHLRMGDKDIPYNDQFQLYMTSKVSNPRYSPETQVLVTLLNFTTTREGLTDQMLGCVVKCESPELETAKGELVVANARMQKQLQDTQDNILKLLSEAREQDSSEGGSILDREDLIVALTEAKHTSEEMTSQLRETQIVERDIDAKRTQYATVAERASVLYFAIAELCLVDPMYQYSLDWFTNLFVQAVHQAPAATVITARCQNINTHFTQVLFRNVCRSLFEHHKPLFGFMLAVHILRHQDLVNPQEWRALTSGIAASAQTQLENPDPATFPQNIWNNILSLSTLPIFMDLPSHTHTYLDYFREYMASANPHTMPVPEPYQNTNSLLLSLLLLRNLRLDKLALGMQQFISTHLGPAFLQTPQFDLSSSFADSNTYTPLLFVLSKGADPLASVTNLAIDMNMRDKLYCVSLGQGQEQKAAKSIALAMKTGGWVMLQNCHLAVSWLPVLEQTVMELVNNKGADVHTDFRMWLTSMPTHKFPVSILQCSIKMTNEPPRGIKANLMRAYNGFSDQTLSKGARAREMRKVIYSLCVFHAVVVERRKFGPLGWNVAYEFTDNDLQVCIAQLRDFMDIYEQVPYQVLHFLTYDINYGGRVTDDLDRRTLCTLLYDYMTPKVMNDDYAFAAGTQYLSIPAGNKQHYQQTIQTLPEEDDCLLFGLHENAVITCAEQATQATLADIVKLSPQQQGGNASQDTLTSIIVSLRTQIPHGWELDVIAKKYPSSYSESMNTVLLQECTMLNRLLQTIQSTLSKLSAAVRGTVVMTSDLERMATSIMANQVPELWAAVAYPSVMGLFEWVRDLVCRVQHMQAWVDKGTPSAIWMGGLFFPQAMLTATLQNYARKHQLAVDTLELKCHVIKGLEDKTRDGICVFGLLMEGARWDADKHSIADSKQKELIAPMPLIWLEPVPAAEATYECQTYECPVYKTAARHGTLATTGHSTNFVMFLQLPTDQAPEKWIKAGCALITQTRYFIQPQF